jgi:hypothetical protein
MSEEQTPVEPAIEQTPSQPVESQMADFLTDDGKFTDSYLSSLPDELGQHSIIEKYGRDPVNIIKGAINAQGLAGKKAEDFWTSEDPDVVASRNKIMGVPESKDAYEYDASDIPEDYRDIATQSVDAFKEFALENKIPKAIAEKVLAWDKERGIEAFEQKQASDEMMAQKVEQELREKWKGDKYEYNISKIKGTLEAAGLESFVNDPAIANNPEYLELILDKMVPLFADDKIIENRMSQNTATLNDTLMELENKMYSYDGGTNDPMYLNMVKQRAELLEKLS